jgi:tRNA pseudouridine32 synthase/23S rRNA pseudouridine746 synthase
MRIVFESPAVVVVDKPAGTLSVPSRMGAADPRPCVGRLLESALRARLWPIHRLDLEVSGLLMFARNPAAHRLGSLAFEGRRVRKRYDALTEGSAPAPASFRWESLIVRGKKRSFEAPHGQMAITQAQLLGRVPSAGLLAPAAGPAPPAELLHFELEPETGRAHQLRVHLANAGFPIAGDKLYGAVSVWGAPHAIALRATFLELTDAATRTALGLPPTLRVPGLVP